MNYYDIQVVLQEVPGEISICFTITGCPVQCEGCHSSYLWNKKNGVPLTEEMYISLLEKYKGLASCVLFMGGEWYPEKLKSLLEIARGKNYKTCLYTGEEKISESISKNLTWLKTGKWNPLLGGLKSPLSNQKFIEIESNKILNHLFLKTNL